MEMKLCPGLVFVCCAQTEKEDSSTSASQILPLKRLSRVAVKEMF